MAKQADPKARPSITHVDSQPMARNSTLRPLSFMEKAKQQEEEEKLIQKANELWSNGKKSARPLASTKASSTSIAACTTARR
jgi:ribosomal protein L4